MASAGPGDSSASAIRPTQVRWQIVGLLMGFAFLGHFNRVSISVAGSEVLTREGGISNEQMGWVYSAFLIVYTAGMLPGGWLIDRLGPRIALTAMGLGMGFCVVLTGVLG
ncbi:MAG: MFS transporter, partial [Planctomyces sp.]